MIELKDIQIDSTVAYALELFDSDLTWVESVLLAVSKATGQNDPCLPGIAKGFAVGLSGKGEVCGAVSGAVLALGLIHGEEFAIGPKTRKFVLQFTEQNDYLRCNDLLGLEEFTPEELLATALNLKSEICDNLVANAVEGSLGLLLESEDQKQNRKKERQ